MTLVTTSARWAAALLLAWLAASPACAQTAAPDGRFVVEDTGGFGEATVDAVRAELRKGLDALAGLGFAPREGLFPVKVALMPGGGVSNSFSGVLVLYQLERNEAPVVHELTHVVAGYHSRLGHWTQEGLASFVQDRYGSNEAFPTFRVPHALARLIVEQGDLLPMAKVMADRNREGYFGIAEPWRRWLAYVQSTSFVTWLIDRWGVERFRRVYDRAVEDIDFAAVYGRPADALTADWIAWLRSRSESAARARETYDRMYAFSRRVGR